MTGVGTARTGTTVRTEPGRWPALDADADADVAGVLPLPDSTYQLLLDAAKAWPDTVATQWIAGPGRYTECRSWTYADLAGTVTRIANAFTALGVTRQDAVTLCGVNTAMLYAATLAAEAVGIAAPVNPALRADRITELIRGTRRTPMPTR